MYLKSIEVHGFKSFANKIVFDFHNGITGIVGPNGSGKSNVGDAVRWVLGEQSAKQLRGSSMQDVIFSGTENRKPLGYAYVAITLDNADHKLPVEYEEVTVARRVYRSGESEYLMNGTSCRLKDVHELFYDTGIGKEGYSIIGQGQIDKILSGKPEERRELFDEAAGIVKFKRRKAVAQKKLEDEKQNLLRVTDILTELEKQLEPLERQAETARHYLKKKEELKILDVNLFLAETERCKEQLSELEKKVTIATQDFEQTKQQVEESKLEYEKIELEIESLNALMEETRKEKEEKTQTKNETENRLNVCKEQIRSIQDRKKQVTIRSQTIAEELSGKKKEQAVLETQKQEVSIKLEEIGTLQGTAKEQLQQLKQSIEQFTADIEEGKNQIFDLLSESASTKAKMQRYDTMLEQLTIQKAEIAQRLLKIKSDEFEQEEQLCKYREEFDELTKLQAEGKEKEKQTEAEILSLQEKIAEIQRDFTEKQTEYHKQKSRLDSLRNITERYDGYGNSIKKVMEQKERVPGIVGVVADIIKVEKTYETAIETALGGSIQNIVTEEEETAKKMITFLKKNKLGRATFLPLTSIRKSQFKQEQALKENGVIGLASDLVQTEQKFLSLASYLLGRTVVVKQIDDAIALARKYRYSLRIVTLEGESLSPGGSMTGGAFKNTSNLLGRRREIEELEDKVSSIETQAARMSKQIESNKAERSDAYQKLEKIKQQLQEQSLQSNTVKINKEQAEKKKQECYERLLELKQESSDLESQIQEITGSKQHIQQELSNSEEEKKSLEEKILEYQNSLEQERQKESDLTGETAEINVETANLKQKYEFIQQNIERLIMESSRLDNEEQELENEWDAILQTEEEKEKEVETLQKSIQEVADGIANAQELWKTLVLDKERKTKYHKGFFQKREEFSDRMTQLDKEIFRLNSQREKMEENRENIINYMWEEYELTFSSALELKKDIGMEASALKTAISSLKDEIRKLGDVNVNAIEDFKSICERYEFLKEQHDDLIQSEATLLEIIEELDTGMRKQFAERFALIQEEYDKAFKELFGGGKGTLQLMDEGDILDAGIRIIAQPPGKKLQNMMQLSGGEKALSAIALLFAIQNLKPSPFCLLDEIEAALDDSNVGRFADYLHKLTKNTQFIIITHRRGTMAAADRLYGITMQEKGVSTLVSVNLIEEGLEQ